LYVPYNRNSASGTLGYAYFDVVVGLAWPNDPESYANSGIATGRASHARYVKGDDPDQKGYPDWGLDMGLTTPPR